MRHNQRILTVALTATALLVGCSKFSSTSSSTEVKISFKTPAGEPVAKVGEAVITSEQLEQYMQKKSAMSSAYGVPDKMRDPKKVLQMQIEKELLAQEAIKLGYLDRPDIQQDLKSLLVRRMTKETEKKVTGENKPSEEEIKAYYDANPDFFHKPEKIKANFVYIPFSADKANSLKAAKIAKRKINDPAEKHKKTHFQSIVSETEQSYGLSDSEKASARLSFKTRNQTEEIFGKNASEKLWALNENGAVSDVVEGKDGYYIFWLAAKKAAVDDDLKTAQPSIERRIIAQKRSEAFAQLVNDLRARTGVTIFDKKVAQLSESPRIMHDKTPPTASSSK